VRGEWALWCLTHNLRKLADVLREQRIAARAALGCRVWDRARHRRWVAGRLLLGRTTAVTRSAPRFPYPPLLIQTGS